MAAEILGIDIGGVIIDRVHEERDATGRGYADAPPVEGAFEAIARLAAGRFRDRVWLVSRCDAPDEPQIREWLSAHDFFGTTGIAPDRVRFCRERHEKTPICQALGVTHFVDDRLEVLGHMIGTVPILYHLRSRAADHDRFPELSQHVRAVTGWNDVLGDLLASH